MKASRFTEEEIIGILKKAEAGMKTADLCREQEISEATFYKLSEHRGRPEEIRVDHGPGFVSRVTGSWCEQQKILLRFIDPGKPMQNGYVESFNGRFRDECLNAHGFLSLAQARTAIEAWRIDYNGSVRTAPGLPDAQ